VNHIEQQVLTEPEAAAFLGISAATLKKSRIEGPREGRICAPSHLKIGRLVRYRLCDLSSWLESHIRSASRSKDGQP